MVSNKNNFGCLSAFLRHIIALYLLYHKKTTNFESLPNRSVSTNIMQNIKITDFFNREKIGYFDKNYTISFITNDNLL